MGYLGRSPTPSPIDSSDIPDNSIDASKIIDGAIAVADVADNAITEAKIADAAVVSLKSGRKNLIINGGFDVWQRGTSIAEGSLDFTADRWAKNGSTSLIERSTDVPTGSTATYSMKQTPSGAKNFILLQPVELPATGNAGVFKVGQTLTFSFWIKGAASGTIALAYDFRDTGISATNYVTAAPSETVSYTTGWTRYISTFTITATPNSTNKSFNPILYASCNVGEVLYITQVQLELGSVATDFEHRSYGEELALCQRYYQRITQAGGDFYIMASKGQSSDTTRFAQTLARPLRASPTISQGDGFSSWRCFRGTSGIAASTSTPTTVGFVENAGFVSLQVAGFSGLTDNFFYGTSPVFSGSGYFDMDSEL